MQNLKNLLFKLRFSHFFLKVYYYSKKFISNYNNFKFCKKETIKRSVGFKKVELKNNKVLEEAILFSKKKFDFSYMKKNAIKTDLKKDFLNICEFSVLDFEPLKNLAIEKNIIEISSNYLRTQPILYSSTVWLSNYVKEEPSSSQLYHFDREDLFQLKVFIPLEPIIESSGPLSVISSKQSSEFIWNNLKKFKIITLKDRICDNEINNNIKNLQESSQIANPGQLIFVDTTNCLQYGSRYSKSIKYHLSFQYISPFSERLNSFMKSFKKNEYSNSLDTLSYVEWKYHNQT